MPLCVLALRLRPVFAGVCNHRHAGSAAEGGVCGRRGWAVLRARVLCMTLDCVGGVLAVCLRAKCFKPYCEVGEAAAEAASGLLCLAFLCWHCVWIPLCQACLPWGGLQFVCTYVCCVCVTRRPRAQGPLHIQGQVLAFAWGSEMSWEHWGSSNGTRAAWHVLKSCWLQCL